MAWKREYSASEAKRIRYNIYTSSDKDVPSVWWYKYEEPFGYTVSVGDNRRHFHTLKEAERYSETIGKEVLVRNRERKELSRTFLNNPSTRGAGSTSTSGT